MESVKQIESDNNIEREDEDDGRTKRVKADTEPSKQDDNCDGAGADDKNSGQLSTPVIF